MHTNSWGQHDCIQTTGGSLTAYKQLGAAWQYIYNSWGQPDSTYKHLEGAWQHIQTAGDSLTVHTTVECHLTMHYSIYITAGGSLTVHTNIWREPGSAYKQLGTAWQCIQLLSAIWQCIQLLRTGWLHTTVEDRLIAYSGWGQADCIQWLRTGWQYLPLLRAAWQKTMSWAIRLLSPIPNISMLLQMFRVICQHTISWAFRTPTMLFLIYQERDSILQCTPDTPAPTTKTREVYNFCLSPFICLFATWKRGLP